MDALTPAERVAFVLHDLFDVPFGSVAAVLGRSTDATKMLASRARGRVRLSEPGDPAGAGGQAGREVIDAFFAATRDGDIEALLDVLAPDVELQMMGPAWKTVARGAATVASRASAGAALAGAGGRMHPAVMDGLPAVLVVVDGRPVTVAAFLLGDGKVKAIRMMADPARLALVAPWVGLPGPCRGHCGGAGGAAVSRACCHAAMICATLAWNWWSAMNGLCTGAPSRKPARPCSLTMTL
jgi:RNA polymerase sigma-70 factor (ECF subfamily)